MTQITYGDYRMEHDTIATSRYNLFKMVNKKITKKEVADKFGKTIGELSPEKSEINIAYGIDLPHAIELISKDIIADKNATYTLAEYIREYKAVLEDVKTLVGLK